jgi:hypothetical protein
MERALMTTTKANEIISLRDYEARLSPAVVKSIRLVHYEICVVMSVTTNSTLIGT